MSTKDDWPQAPILATLPATARLDLTFDPDLLRSDLDGVRSGRWSQPRIVDDKGIGGYATSLDWQTLSLRSIGGNADRTDPGGPGLCEFADTPYRAQVPHISDLMRSIPAPLRSVRLMSLGPGAESPVHLDTKCGLPWGKVRLHVPIITTPGAVLEIDGASHCWPAGQLWYADFTRMHVVRNTDSITRVHLVLDCFPTNELLDLFPHPFDEPPVRAECLMARDAAAPTADNVRRSRCRFTMPASFRNHQSAEGAFGHDSTFLDAAIDRHGDGLALYLDGRPDVALVHVGDLEFRFAGWTSERTIQIRTGPGGMSVILRTRVGSAVRASEIAAATLIEQPTAQVG